MRIRQITICLLFVTILFSCKKEDLSDVGNPIAVKTQLLSKVLDDNQPSYEYLYNDSNLISEVKSRFDYTLNHYNSKGQIVTVEYYANDDILSSDANVSASAMNDAGLITAENGKKNGTITYEYNDNEQLIKSTNTLIAPVSSEYSEFSYDGNNRISRQTMYWDNTATGYIDYSYDGNGNLISEMLYNTQTSGDPELITTTSYTFDNKPNPYKMPGILMIPGTNTNRNNIITETYTIHLSTDQGPDNVQTTTNVYQYNSLGYPLSKNGNVTFVYE
jgi:hypothetical protein